MTGAPQVWIGDRLMDDLATDDQPVLAGLSFEWGTDSQIDFTDAETLSAELLIRSPSNLDFLYKGAPLGLLDPDSGETLFAGRISTLTAARDENIDDALRVRLGGAGTLADLSNHRLERISWLERASDGTLQVSSARRREQLRSVLPGGWTLAATATNNDWVPARAQLAESQTILPLIDRHARTTIARRHTTSRYVPGRGLINEITLTRERDKAAPADQLTAAANGQWQLAPSPWPNASALIRLTAAEVGVGTEWEKNPEDTVTDVTVSSTGSALATNTDTGALENQLNTDSDVWVYAYPGVPDMPALQRAYGTHGLTIETDIFAGWPGSGSPHIGNLVSYWLDVDAEWRPTGLEIPDSRAIRYDSNLLAILSVTRRYNAYLTVDELPALTPQPGSRVRGYLLAGKAAWTGKKWEISLTLGRVPRPAAGAGALTFNTIRDHADPRISAATAETVGPYIMFSDFSYIGKA